MQVERIVVGELETNCYILSIGKDVLVIDPGDNYEFIIEKISDKNLLGILITHNHFDHVGALKELVQNYNIDVYSKKNLDEKEYKFNNFKFYVIYTPGHTNDSITFYFKDKNCMFTGDFIFKDTLGRWDLPTGNAKDMLSSIEKINKYNSDIIIYPGHGELTILKNEKKNLEFYKKSIFFD